MRHRNRGRKLGRNSSHRKAMFRNMAASLIKTAVIPEDAPVGSPKVAGRIVTTVPKAKELRPIIERLITLARKAIAHETAASEFATDAARQSEEWKQWRASETWQKWAQAMAPAVDYRRRAFAALRDQEAVSILFGELGPRFAERDGGYTRIVRLPQRRLGDAGEQALIEFVGERDRVKRAVRTAPTVVANAEAAAPAAVASEEAASEE